MSIGHEKWSKRYDDSRSVAQTTAAEETARRDAKTARLKQERLAAEAEAPPATPKLPARRKRPADSKRPV